MKLSGAPGTSRIATNQIAAIAKKINERSKACDFNVPRDLKAIMIKAARDPHRNCVKKEPMFQYGSHCFAPPVSPYCQPFNLSSVMKLFTITGFNSCRANIQATIPSTASDIFLVAFMIEKRTIGSSK